MERIVNKRPLRLVIIQDFGDWVTCRDVADGTVWSLPRVAYDTYRFVGLPYLSPDIKKKLNDLTGGKNFASLSKEEKQRIIVKSLEEFYNLPIENILPNV